MPDPQESYPLDLAEIEAWVLSHASPGRRVLEIGAGDGALTRRLAAAGLDVVGVDPHADPDDPLIRRESFESFGSGGAPHHSDGHRHNDGHGSSHDHDQGSDHDHGSGRGDGDVAPFDVIVASVSLHHLHDLDAAADALRRLSHAGTVALVREFDRDLVGDEATLQWWFYQRHAREAVDAQLDGHRQPATFDEFASLWRSKMDHHVQPWPSVLAMLERAGFETETQWSSAYLFRWGLLEQLRPLEERLIADGQIKSVGIRWVGRRKG